MFVRRSVAFPAGVLLTLVVLAILGGLLHPAQARTPAGSTWPVVGVAEKVMPSVVGVVSYRGAPDGPTLPRGSGTGVIIRPQGYIVTNDHVVRGASVIKVTLADGRTLVARLVGADPLTDIAVLKVEAKGLRPATFVPEKDVEVGELAIAIGNPMGPAFSRTVTVGVVSGLKRSLGAGYAQRAYALIQTDAAINPGNSGGPLVDAEGRVIGINSVKVATPGFESMGFAIPSDIVEEVARAIIADGKVIRPWLGVGLLGPEAAMRLGMPIGAGLFVQDVYPGGPGQVGGIQAGDVILSVDGKAMTTLQDLYVVLSRHRIGQTVNLEVRRGQEKIDLKVVLGSMPEAGAS